MKHKLTISLNDAQLDGLRAFADDWSAWHLNRAEIPDELALLLCVFYTAVGPKHPNEVGACGLDPVEIDAEDLIEVAKKWLKKNAGDKATKPKKLYRIARDNGRKIGLDLLVTDYGGMRFTHPSFLAKEFPPTKARIFEGSQATCKAMVAQMGGCFIIDSEGRPL